jgi:hypothetical protein
MPFDPCHSNGERRVLGPSLPCSNNHKERFWPIFFSIHDSNIVGLCNFLCTTPKMFTTSVCLSAMGNTAQARLGPWSAPVCSVPFLSVQAYHSMLGTLLVWWYQRDLRPSCIGGRLLNESIFSSPLALLVTFVGVCFTT